MRSLCTRFPVKLAAGLLALTGCIDKGEGPGGDSGEAVADDTATDTGEAIEWGWVDGDMGDCEGGTGMTSAFDGSEFHHWWDGAGDAWGPYVIEGNGTICGAACTHDYAWVHLWYDDGWSVWPVELPANIDYSTVPDDHEWVLKPGVDPGPEEDIGETITCQVNTSAGIWKATIEILASE